MDAKEIAQLDKENSDLYAKQSATSRKRAQESIHGSSIKTPAEDIALSQRRLEIAKLFSEHWTDVLLPAFDEARDNKQAAIDSKKELLEGLTDADREIEKAGQAEMKAWRQLKTRARDAGRTAPLNPQRAKPRTGRGQVQSWGIPERRA